MERLAVDLLLGSVFVRLLILPTQPIHFLCVRLGEFGFESVVTCQNKKPFV